MKNALALILFLALCFGVAGLGGYWTSTSVDDWYQSLRNSAAGFAHILLLWLAILATMIAFRRISTPAALLLLPCLLWVSYAAALNLALWRMN